MTEKKKHESYSERFLEKWDFPRFEGIPQAYIILGIPRSGTNALVDGLISTGLAGAPLEYDNPVFREILEARWKVTSIDELLKKLFAYRTGPNGIFGTKLLIPHLYHPGTFLPHLLDYSPKYIVVKRLDKLAQGVSRWRAEITGIWRAQDRAADTVPKESYNFGGILSQIVFSLREEKALDQLIRLPGVSGEALIYEEFSKDIPGTVSWLMERLFSISVPKEAVSLGDMKRQRNTVSKYYMERFLKDFKARESQLEENLAMEVRKALVRCSYL